MLKDRFEIEDYEIKSGGGTTVDAIIIPEFEFGEIDHGQNLYGYINYGDSYTLAWHEGQFTGLETDEKMTVSEFGEDKKEVEKFAEKKTLWWKRVDRKEVEEILSDYQIEFKKEDLEDKDYCIYSLF